VAVAGMTATLTQACPTLDAGVDSGGSAAFTATANSLTLFWSGVHGIIEVIVHEKAP
jgi:hypothetical protein